MVSCCFGCRCFGCRSCAVMNCNDCIRSDGALPDYQDYYFDKSSVPCWKKLKNNPDKMEKWLASIPLRPDYLGKLPRKGGSN